MGWWSLLEENMKTDFCLDTTFGLIFYLGGKRYTALEALALVTSEFDPGELARDYLLNLTLEHALSGRAATGEPCAASDDPLNWDLMTDEAKLQFCWDHMEDVCGLRTTLSWEALSPTSQYLLHGAGIGNLPCYL
jgi:hypothetical protein